jgi:Cu/Zn superoxide dismutase
MKHFTSLVLIASMPLVMGAIALADDATGTSTANSVTIQLKEQNASGESGTATLTQQDDGVLVVMSLTGAGADPQPAHIHPGPCATLDPKPKYPLSNVVDGKSTTTVKGVKLADLETGAYAINVHKSASDIKTYVACGDIPKAGGAMSK